MKSGFLLSMVYMVASIVYIIIQYTIVYSIYGSYRCHLEVAPVGILDPVSPSESLSHVAQDSMKLAGTVSMGLSLHMPQCIGPAAIAAPVRLAWWSPGQSLTVYV